MKGNNHDANNSTGLEALWRLKREALFLSISLAMIFFIVSAVIPASYVKYPVDIEHKDQPFGFLKTNAQPFFIAENGIKGINSLDKKFFPDHNAVFNSDAASYTMTASTLRVPLTWNQAGIAVTKTYIFTKGSCIRC